MALFQEQILLVNMNTQICIMKKSESEKMMLRQLLETRDSQQMIYKIKRHIFVNEYDLGEDGRRRFDPDYDMAVSWQRLIEGKDIQEMDTV